MFRSIQSPVIASLVLIASLVSCQLSLAVEAAGSNGHRGVRLLEPGGNSNSYPVPGTPSTETPAGPPMENLLATPQYYNPAPANQRYHAIWTVTVYARNAAGQTQTGTYHVSSHTWDGANWIPNPSAMEQLNREIASLPSRGWYAYNWNWQQYGVCVGN